jgi:hypothetical protein
MSTRRLARNQAWVAPFVFSGVVSRRRDATLSVIDVTELDAIIAVDRVYRRPPGVIDFTGMEVTLRGGATLTLEAGRKAVFAADGWLYGDSLALIQIAQLDESDSKRADERIEAAAQRAARDALSDRLARADLVVVARVAKTNPHVQSELPPASEHDPVWWEAWLAVQSVEKGKTTQRPRLLYPSSLDEYWYESPKLQPGDERVFLMQQDQRERGPRQYRLRGYTALHPLDVQPLERLNEVRALLKQQR